MKKISFILVAFFLMCGLNANDSGVVYDQVTGSLIGSNNDKIQMVKEDVVYKRDRDDRDGTFYTTFYFKNISTEVVATTFAFPIEAPDDKNRDGFNEQYNYVYDEKAARGKFNFKTTVNSKPYPSEFDYILFPSISDQKIPSFITKDVVIQPNETIQVFHSYTAGPRKVYYDNTGTSSYFYEYISKTGASWAKQIEEANFTFKFKKLKFIVVKNDNEYVYMNYASCIKRIIFETQLKHTVDYSKKDYIEISFKFKNIKPNFNITIQETHKGTPYFASHDRIAEEINSENFNDSWNPLWVEIAAADLTNEEYLLLLYNWIKNHQNSYNIKDIATIFFNYCYAVNGYKFSDPKWSEFFSGMPWYKPTTKSPPFSEEHQRMIDEIAEIIHR